MRKFPATFERDFIRLARRIALSLLAVVALLLVGTTEAKATCGDYLSGGMHGHGQPMPVGGGAHKSHVPCHGPSCDRAPTNHSVPVPVVSLEVQDRWFWMAVVEIPSLNQSSLLARLSEPLVLPMIAYRLDRPPKV